MNQLIIQNVFVTASPKAKMRDNKGGVKYTVVKEHALPTREVYSIQDAGNNLVGKIEKIRYTLGMYNLPRWTLTCKNKKIEARKEINQFHSEYKITGEWIAAQGDWLGRTFNVYQHHHPIAKITVSENNDYLVAFEKETNEQLVVCFVFLIMWIRYLEHK